MGCDFAQAMQMAEQCSAVPVWTVGPFAGPPCSRPEAQSVVKSEIVKTEAGDREEGGLVKEKVEGRA